MATAKRLTKAGVKLVDPAVKDAYHDEVLNWAIDNLATLIKDRFSLDAEAVESGLTKAKEKFNSYLTHDVEILIANALKNNGVHGWEGFIDFDAATQGEFKSAQESLSLIRKHVSQFCLLESAGRAKVASIEVMKRVAYLETKSAIHKAYGAYIKEIPAGYVDLFASIFIPSGFYFHFDGVSLDNLRSIDFSDQSSCIEFARAIRPTTVEMRLDGEVYPFFFSVRTDPFTLGEVLQELKEIMQLDDRKQKASLIVDSIDSLIREKIEAEGFAVIARSDYF